MGHLRPGDNLSILTPETNREYLALVLLTVACGIAFGAIISTIKMGIS